MIEKYITKQERIEQEIAQLDQELVDAQSDLFGKMGISSAYTIGESK